MAPVKNTDPANASFLGQLGSPIATLECTQTVSELLDADNFDAIRCGEFDPGDSTPNIMETPFTTATHTLTCAAFLFDDMLHWLILIALSLRCGVYYGDLLKFYN